jgi:small subunit ribosomal protein S6
MKRVTTAAEGPRRYEGMFLVESGVASKDWDGTEKALREVVEKSGGTVLSAGKWDERKLAYEIRGAKRATYWLCYFQAPGDVPGRIRATLTLSETVLRGMVLVLDRAEEIPQDVTTRRSTIAIGEDKEIH